MNWQGHQLSRPLIVIFKDITAVTFVISSEFGNPPQDMEHDRCFVMPLERDEVPKPRSFYDLMNLLNSGAFDLDVKRIRHDYRVVTPAIEGDVQELGSVVFH